MEVGIIGLVVVSLAPIVFLLWYFDRQDKEKESRRFLWKIFLWGVVVTFVAGIAEVISEYLFLDLFFLPIIKLVASAFIFTAAIEEGLKYWVVKRKVYHHPAFNQYYDGVIYAVVASLGFAALENLFYVLDSGLFVGIIRALFAVPAHALFGAFMGYYIGRARFAKSKGEEKSMLKKGLLGAIFFHGLYDFLLFTASPLALFVIPLLLGLFINVRRKINHLHALDNIKGAVVPVKWKAGKYIKGFFGLAFFTLGFLLLALFLLGIGGDPDITLIIEEVVADSEITKDAVLQVFGGGIVVSWLLAYAFLRKSIKG